MKDMTKPHAWYFLKPSLIKRKICFFLGETWAGRQMGRRHLGLFRLKPKQATPITTYHLPHKKNKAGRILEIIPGVLISPMWVVTAGISRTIFQPMCMDNQQTFDQIDSLQKCPGNMQSCTFALFRSISIPYQY